MKCGSCGAEVKEGTSFCINCGAKIIAKKKFCMECGAPLVGGGSFCTECGAKVNNSSIESMQKEEAIELKKEDFLTNVFVKSDDCSSNDETKEDSEGVEEDATSDADIVSDDAHKEKIEENKVDKVAGTLIDKLRNIWKNEGVFFKCAWIMLVVFVLTFLFMVLNEGADFAIIAFFQACLTIVSLLIHVNKLPIDRKWIKYALLAFAGALSIVFVLALRDRLFEHDYEYGVSTYEYEDVALPISTDDCVGMNYKDVNQLLSDAGFYYIDYEEIKDLKPSESEQYGQVERITINGNDHVAAGTALKENSRVVIKYHTYLDCEVSVHIDFASNLIFNKYSVKVELQGQEDKTLSHGEDKDITYSMAPGKYTLKFVSTESSSVTGEVELEVAGDINI
jgi:uncharacterized Zn finger protein (UPF0148 family)